MRKSKNTVVYRILSAVLATTLAVSAGFTTTLTTVATSGGATNFSGGGRTSDCSYSINDGEGVIKIVASKIDDASTVQDMANPALRYGLDGYPIYMLSGRWEWTMLELPAFTVDNVDTILEKLYVNNIMLNGGKAYKGTGGGDNSIIYDSSDNGLPFTTYRMNRQMESTDGFNYKRYRPNTDNTTVNPTLFKDNGCDSIYLEDAFRYLYNHKTDNTVSAFDKLCFLYFFTRMTGSVNQDSDLSNGGYTALGEALRYYLTGDLTAGDFSAYGMRKNSVTISGETYTEHEIMIQRGYIVALALIYGAKSTPVKTLLNNTEGYVKNDTGFSGGQLCWSADSKLSSIVVERMQNLKKAISNNAHMSTADYNAYYRSGNGNSIVDKGSWISYPLHAYLQGIISSGYSTYSDILDSNTASTFYYENAVDSLGIYYRANTIYGSIGWGSCYVKLLTNAIYPMRQTETATEQLTCKNYNGVTVRAFGGWGYFPFKTGGGKIIAELSPTRLRKTDTYTLADSVTYNAFLTDNQNYGGDTLTFGEDGHVMTDLVYLSSPVQFNSKSDYTINLQLNDKINLSTPVPNTEYSLKRVGYRITYPDGTKFQDGEVKADTTGKVTITVGKDIWENTDLDKIMFRESVRNLGTDEGLKIGYYTDMDDANIHYYYYVYVYENGVRKQLYTDNKGNFSTTKKAGMTEATTGSFTKEGNGIADYNYPANVTGNSWQTDGNAQSTNFVYVKIRGEYYPARCMSGRWVFYPLCTLKSLLVQVRGDYTAKLDTNLYQQKDVEEYLLSKNLSTSDFTKQTVYTMVDEETVDCWGTLILRNNTSMKGTNGSIVNNGEVTAGSFVDAGFNGDLPHLSGSSTNIYDLANREYGKFRYFSIYVPYVSRLGSKNSGYILLDEDMPITTREIQTTVVPKVDTKVTDTGYTKQMYTNGLGTGTSINSLEVMSNTNAIKWFPAELYAGSFNENLYRKNLLSADLTTLLVADDWYSDYRAIAPQKDAEVVGYQESVFAKMLASYQYDFYKKRADIALELTPKWAGWITDSAGTKDVLGLEKGYTATLLDTQQTIDSGFVRFGKTSTTKADMFKPVLTNRNTCAGLLYVEDITGVAIGNEFIGGSSILNGSVTQSAIDIPIKYTVNNRQAGTTSTNPPATTYGNTGLTDTEVISSSAVPHVEGSWSVVKVYPEVTMWGEKEGKATEFYTAITVGQRKREIPNVTYSTLSLENTTPSVKVTATATAYDTRAKKLAERLGSANAPVLYSGTALNIAVGGTGGKVTTYVLGVSDRYKNDSGVALGQVWENKESKVVATQAMQELLSPLSAVSEDKLSIVSNSLTSFDLNSNSSTTAVTLSGNVNQQVIYYELKVESGVLKSVTAYRGNTALQTYTVNGTAVTTGTQNSATLTATQLQTVLTQMKLIGADSVLKTSFEYDKGGAITGALGGIVADRFKANWYQEDCSTLAIKVFEGDVNLGAKTYSEQIPITLGPKTPSNKNSYFSSGYKGYIDTTTEIKYTGTAGTVNSLTVENVRSTRSDINSADFIVSDVTINEATGF